MSSLSSDPSEAIIICTRNRPKDLNETLRSISAHALSDDLLLSVVDASDEAERAHTRGMVEDFEDLPSTYRPYTGVPSLTRQRNTALAHLPPSIEIVHFIDDDVTVHPGYFDALSDVLRTHPDVGGVGGIVVEPSDEKASRRVEKLKQLFFLSHAEAGRVLPSGCTTSAQHPSSTASTELRDTEWLNGCSSYRRVLLEQHRFDETLTGYSMLEDLDLSYRIHQKSRLVVQPEARLTHRRSTRNRFDTERYNRALTVHRRWFIEKHFDDLESRLAYWWSLVGRLLAITASSTAHCTAALRGLLHGLRTVLTRNHSLLSD
jgi:GT2 family glycosyltransferase